MSGTTTTGSATPAGAKQEGSTRRTRRRARRAERIRDAGGQLPTRSLVLRYILLLVVFAICIGPFLWQLSTSLKGTTEDIYTFPPRWFPSHPTLGNYDKVAQIIPVWDYALNSLKVAASNVVTNVIGSSMAGYALARLRFKGRKLAGVAFVMAMLVPLESIMIAQFTTMRELHLNNTLIAVVLPGCIGAMNVLLMRNAFANLPYEIEEAAIIDGANVWQRFLRVALPSVKGTIAVVAIFAFMGAWDDFLWPLIVLSDTSKFTLTVGLNYLNGTFNTNPRVVAAGTIIAVLPLIVMFACLQRFFFRGVGEGAVKG
ncbi:ABC transporter permease [Mangrovactinospora gilvigrisea]|uniref:ABC transporter permease n=1 Tax=Mangrovactinospora gilvigrisea TaxID=1428644 RepID=A0A1J7C3L1_9ACTN|nr:carbohydrate ABC transporter permease [Mangrovactinospora gilvigrisea]OIV36148.1 ABC transporter permease [Mangrovactinospora gilvigrisea]